MTVFVFCNGKIGVLKENVIEFDIGEVCLLYWCVYFVMLLDALILNCYVICDAVGFMGDLLY